MKKYSRKCPVCDTDVEVDADYLDFTLMEESMVCGKCCMYAFQYATGSYQECIKIGGEWQEWFWGYGEEGDEMLKRQGHLNIAIRYARLEYNRRQGMTTENVKKFIDGFSAYLESKGSSLDEYIMACEVEQEVSICPICDEAMFTFVLETGAGDLVISNATNHYGCLTLLSALKQYAEATVMLISIDKDGEADVMVEPSGILAELADELMEAMNNEQDPEYPFKN